MAPPDLKPLAGDDSAYRVAVVAVHGVSDPEAGSSARAVANLLLEQSWRHAEEVLLAIDLPPLPGVAPRAPASASSKAVDDTRKGSRVDERSHRVREALASSQHQGGRDPSRDFQEGLLEGYEPEAALAYRTPLIALRQGPASEPRIDVDVLEFYWADLSRAGQGSLRFFGELYQLLAHLPSLGRHALDAEAIRQGKENSQWRRAAERQAWLIRVLTLGIVLLNLLMVPPAAAIASSALPEAWRAAALVLLGGVGGMSLVAFKGLRGGWLRGLLEVGGGLGGGGAAAWGLARWIGIENAVAIAAALVAGLAALAIAALYGRVRPGALRGAAFGLLGVGLVGLLLAVFGFEDRNAVRIGVQLVATLVAALRLAWFVLFVLASAQFASFFLLRGANRADGSRGSTWTARFSLSLAAWSFLVVTLSLWAAAARAVWNFLPSISIDVWGPMFSVAGGEQALPDWIKALITATGGYAFTLGVALLTVLGVVLAVGLAPSIRHEIWPPSAASGDFQAQHGRTTAGLEVSWKAAELLAVGFALVTASSLYIFLKGMPGTPGGAVETLQWSAAGLLLFFFVGRRGFGDARLILDVVLDIDNYMRGHPRGAAPRVRMFERLHAIVHHLQAGGRKESRPYDAIVLVAHSQGSVIVADFLRLAAAKKWLGQNGPALHLFTMGCPLRQLYYRAFPALYAWTGSIDNKALPDFGLASWTNLYRAGDYIGRELPLPDDDPSARNVRVGLGAHTHYWDETASAVGKTLDHEICRMASIAAGTVIRTPRP